MPLNLTPSLMLGKGSAMMKYAQIKYVWNDHIFLVLYGIMRSQKPPVQIRFSLFVNEYGMWGGIIESQNVQSRSFVRLQFMVFLAKAHYMLGKLK